MASTFSALVSWYVVVQLCAVAALPLAFRFFYALPDRGYAFAKILGVFLVGVVLWLGTSYGLLRNEFGGALIALGLVAAVSYAFGGYRALRGAWNRGAFRDRGAVWSVVSVEALFVIAFGVWAWVRMHDPAANHTEQPMDLMFMNSIWTSASFPPRDAWLAGYPISYYYLGYWLLTTLGLLSSTPPSLAYNAGQASWYALLLVSGYGLGFNLFVLGAGHGEESDSSVDSVSVHGGSRLQVGSGVMAGLLTAMFVGVIGNLQVVLEWLYARGADMAGIAAWFDVNGFPENAQQSGRWYIGYDWWWWRSSRVLADQDLLGNHVEVINEFPMFSYILGDNHPHVLAMPVVILVIAMALSLFLHASRTRLEAADAGRAAAIWKRILASMPMGFGGLALVAVVSGGLVFLNTWDYPPYWLLLTACLFAGLRYGGRTETGKAALVSAVFGIVLAGATLAVYMPYFLTAQSQAGGFVPNLFNPSRLQQVMLMFGAFVPAVIGLLVWAWRDARPRANVVVVALAVALGVPATLLAVSALLVTATDRGRSLLDRFALPAGASGHMPFILERWLTRPYTFLLFGAGLALSVAIIWAALSSPRRQGAAVGLFVLIVAALGLLLVYVPEFVFLRDNFGTRMNTVFKFYYQAWLLFAIAAAYTSAMALFVRGKHVPAITSALSWLTLVAAMAALLYPVAGVYSKTLGFAAEERTLDATAYVARENPSELAAVTWVLAHTEPGDIVLEGKGSSYRGSDNRISTMTGRATLLGWDGHEAQWRGESYGEMAGGRAEALERIYRTARPEEIPQLLDEWDIDYVYVGPAERSQYGVTPASERRIAEVMDLAFDRDGARIYRRR